MAKKFSDLVDKTRTPISDDVASKRTKELLKEYLVSNVTWLDLYNFLYHKAHDFNNLGKFNWNEKIVVLDASTGKEYNIDNKVFVKDSNAELFCNPSLVIKLADKE